MPAPLHIVRFQPVAADGSPLALAPGSARIQAIVEQAGASAASGQDAALPDATPIEALAGRITAALLAFDAATPPQAGPAPQAGAAAHPEAARPEPLTSEAAPPQVLTPEAVRDTIREIGPFTAADLAQRLGVSLGHARLLVKRHARRGMIRRAGTQPVRRGRPRHVWVFQTPAAAVTAPARLPAPSDVREAVAGPPARSLPVAGVGKVRSGRKEIDKLLSAARRQGCQVSRGASHFKVRTPSGRLVIAPSTPSDHRAVANTRSKLRRAGVRV